MENELEEKLEGDIKREFQLERMILFSDAVFAIVITLMAIEIKVPEAEKKYTSDELLHHIKVLVPTILAYLVSFFFIGITWYRHLQLFGKLKDYDRGLVICNLAMLFFIGLFPFGASMISHPNNILLPYTIYFIIAFASLASQAALHYYIYTKTSLLHVQPTEKELKKLKISIGLLILLGLSFGVGAYLFENIANPDEKPFALMLLFIVPLGKRFLERRYGVK